MQNTKTEEFVGVSIIGKVTFVTKWRSNLLHDWTACRQSRIFMTCSLLPRDVSSRKHSILEPKIWLEQSCAWFLLIAFWLPHFHKILWKWIEHKLRELWIEPSLTHLPVAVLPYHIIFRSIWYSVPKTNIEYFVFLSKTIQHKITNIIVQNFKNMQHVIMNFRCEWGLSITKLLYFLHFG